MSPSARVGSSSLFHTRSGIYRSRDRRMFQTKPSSGQVSSSNPPNLSIKSSQFALVRLMMSTRNRACFDLRKRNPFPTHVLRRRLRNRTKTRRSASTLAGTRSLCDRGARRQSSPSVNPATLTSRKPAVGEGNGAGDHEEYEDLSSSGTKTSSTLACRDQWLDVEFA